MSSYVNTGEMARELDRVQQMSTERLMTGWFSQMDELVLKMLEAYPQLRSAHSAFSQARHGIGYDMLTDVTWEEMKRTSRELAEAVRALGNVDIQLCGRRTEYSSECGHALLPNGECGVTWPGWHAES